MKRLDLNIKEIYLTFYVQVRSTFAAQHFHPDPSYNPYSLGPQQKQIRSPNKKVAVIPFLAPSQK